MTESCAECRFWGGSYIDDVVRYREPEEASYFRSDADTADRKYCRRQAPRRAAKARIGFWPPTLPTDWCGEFEAI